MTPIDFFGNKDANGVNVVLQFTLSPDTTIFAEQLSRLAPNLFGAAHPPLIEGVTARQCYFHNVDFTRAVERMKEEDLNAIKQVLSDLRQLVDSANERVNSILK